MDSGILGLIAVLVLLGGVWLGRAFLSGYRGQPAATTGRREGAPVTTELQLMQDMTESQRLLFQGQMAQHRKSVGVAALLAFFGFIGMHRFYLGQIGLGFLYAVTLGFFLVGALIDLIRIRSIVEQVNNRKAQEIAVQVKLLAPPKA
jgi:TM2 domain-containing membrane protein YozV